MDIFDTLTALNGAFGPSGDESGVAAVIAELARPFVDEITTDVMGSLICHKNGPGPKVMFAAHMDSIGLIVTHIEKEGFLRFGALGGLTPQNILYTPVRFKNGARGLIAADENADRTKLKLDELYVDIGAPSAEAAKAVANVGDMAVYDTAVRTAGDKVISPYLDNRIACFVLLAAMESLEKSQNDLYFVFTTQEELGLRGAATAAYAIAPDYGVSVDVMSAGDLPGSAHNGSIRQGDGAGIKVMDASVICHPQVVSRLKALAEERGIPFQMDVSRRGGTDAGAIHKSRGGVYTGGISIPSRYTHTPTEMISRADAEACARLVQAFAEAELEAV